MLEDDNSLAGSLQGSPAPSTVEGDSGRDNEGFASDSEEALCSTNDVIECPKKVCSYVIDVSSLALLSLVLCHKDTFRHPKALLGDLFIASLLCMKATPMP